ncbi:MAG: hypothetical protein HPY83_17320 [Anaerolineae bacterium]|nr:hypothetical protein [Anaerolineae bacterium]
MSDPIKLRHALPVISLSSVERSLAVAQTLLPASPDVESIRHEIQACRSIVSGLAHQLGVPWQARPVSRFVRRELAEVGRALRSMRAVEGEAAEPLAPMLREGRQGLEGTINRLEAVAWGHASTGEAPLAPVPGHPAEVSLSGEQALLLGSAMKVMRQYLAAARAWAEAADMAMTGTLEASYSHAESRMLQSLCLESDAKVAALAAAFGLREGPPPWEQALAERLLEAGHAANSLFQVAMAARRSSLPGTVPLSPTLGQLAIRLKELHRHTIPAD